MPKVRDKQVAIDEGRKFYVSPTPCKKCGCVIKFVSSMSCHHCGKVRGRERLREGVTAKYQTPEKTRARLRRWRKNNYHKYQQQWLRDTTNTHRQALRRARLRGQSPPLNLQEQSTIISLYHFAKFWSEITGIPYEIDHIKPIAKGGLHHPDNLQILSKDDNRQKGCNY